MINIGSKNEDLALRDDPIPQNLPQLRFQFAHIGFGGALCRFVWNETISSGPGRRERMSWQVLELGHAQVGDGDEVRRGADAALGLLEQSVHGLDEGIGAAVGHRPHPNNDESRFRLLTFTWSRNKQHLRSLAPRL